MFIATMKGAFCMVNNVKLYTYCEPFGNNQCLMTLYLMHFFFYKPTLNPLFHVPTNSIYTFFIQY